MDIKEVNRNDIKQLVEYTNQELAKGRTQENISKEDFNMSIDWLRKKLTSNGYKRILNEYVKMDQQIEGQESFINNINTEATQEPQEGEKAIKDINTPVKKEVLKKADNEVETMQEEIKKSVGRPKKYIKDSNGSNAEKSKVTFEIDNKILKALRFKKVSQGIALNSYIEQLLKDNIEPKYMDMVDK